MVRSNFGVDLGDNAYEFFEANNSVSILIGIVDHLINLGGWEVFSNTGSNLFKGFGSDTLSIRIKFVIDGLDGGLTGGIASKSEDF